METDRIQNSLARPQAVPWRAELRIQNANGALRCSPGFWILDSGFSRGPRRRRGTVLVFVMAVLVLLALLGLGMMIAVRGDRQKLTPQRETLALEAVMDSAVRLVRERLRDDIWGLPPAAGLPDKRVPLSRIPRDPPRYLISADPNDDPNSNEPFDAPGAEDRWLSSTYPYSLPDDPNLRWFRVSYLGPIRGEPTAATSSYPPPPIDDPNDPNHSELRELVLSDPMLLNSSIPPWTPAYGRQLKLRLDLNPSETNPPLRPNFRQLYRDIYDVDGNGYLDLYDADGDGIPDSPISFTFPIDTPAPTDQPKRVHVAIRIVDNASKLNVNTGNSRFKPGTAWDEMFDEFGPDLQLRGRRVTEALLDAAAKGDIIGQLVANLRGGTLLPAFANLHDQYYALAVQRLLMGGAPVSNVFFPLYGLRDEASLTHRFSLVPYANRMASYVGWVGNIDQDLFSSLCWSRVKAGSFLRPTYQPLPDPDRFRWRRLGLDERIVVPPEPNVAGWQELMDPNSLWVVKRPMLTAFNGESERRLPNLRPALPNDAEAVMLRGTDFTVIVDGTECKRRLMPPTPLVGWPDPNVYAYPVRSDGTILPVAGLYDYEKVSLNYPIDPTAPGMTAGEIIQRKADYVAMLACTFYVSAAVPRSPTGINDPNNTWQAWQAAANILDYRDTDDVPTVVKQGTAVLAVGLERQPFITEVKVWRNYVPGAGDPPEPGTITNTVYVELFNPYSTAVGVADPAVDPNGQFRVEIRPGSQSFDLTTPLGAGQFTTSAVFNNAMISPASTVVLVRRLRAPGAYSEDIVCDAQPLALDAPMYVSTSATAWSDPTESEPNRVEDYQRDTREWRFTVAKAVHREGVDDTEAGVTFGAANTGTDLSASVYPSHRVIRNTGIGVRNPPDPNEPYPWWTFDTPGELSRVMTIGDSIGTGIPVRTSTSTLAYLQAQPPASDPNHMADGRLNFSRPRPAWDDPNDPRRIFGYVTAVGANHDLIDNDGDGVADVPDATALNATDRSEAHRLNYRQVGRVNVNTAPLPVLYSVPYMVDSRLNVVVLGTQPPVWDVAAGIVALREGRPAASLFGHYPKLTIPDAVPAAGLRPKRFRTLGDLADATRETFQGAKPDLFAVNRFAVDTTDLVAHDGTTNKWSPEFDATAAPVATPAKWAEPNDAHDASYSATVGAGVVDDIRERDILLARWGNILTTRSDVYTVYIALIDDEGEPDPTDPNDVRQRPRYLRRCQFTLDRVNCFRDPRELPVIFGRVDTNYYDDTR